MVILDDDHSREHVLKEMITYGDIVTSGCYLIVEDSFIDLFRKNGSKGPSLAINKFLKNNKSFVNDKTCAKFHSSFNPNGYLRKI